MPLQPEEKDELINASPGEDVIPDVNDVDEGE
jgi:hypothetical protein